MNLHKNKWIAISLAVLVFIGLKEPANAQQSNKKALLWEISGNGLKESSYLFGTYHLLTDSYLTETPEINLPFKNAKGVVVEMVIDSSKLQSMGMMAIMPDKKISDLISPEDFKLVSSELESLMGVNLKMMDQLKPMSVMVIMTLMYSQKLNEATLKKYPGLPMDYHFAASGKKAGKIVTPLETMEEQLSLLYDHLPVQEQANQLVSYVKQKDLAMKMQVDLNTYYLAKDLENLYSMLKEMPEELGASDFMLKDRNVKWMNTLPGLMKNGSQFIAVGALHLAGPDGLITLLQQQGYKVEPVIR
jgi:uncharacterized protein YbaP (TraB family)